MTSENTGTTNARARLSELLSSDVYKENLDFWSRAWSPVKAPYTQMPEMDYLALVPELLEKNKARTVLDLGCGSGWLSIYLARLKFKVTGIDVSDHAIELGRMWAEQEGHEIKFDAGDIADMPYAKASFDAVVANAIFEHLTYDLAKETLSRLAEVIVSGGCFVGCFDKVWGGPGEYFELNDGTHVYTDRGRRGMMLRYFNDDELKGLFEGWTIEHFQTFENGTRVVCASPK